jgi:hypothetical protein
MSFSTLKSRIMLSALMLAALCGFWILWPKTNSSPAAPVTASTTAPEVRDVNLQNPPVRSHVKAGADKITTTAKEIVIMRPNDLPAAVETFIDKFAKALKMQGNRDLLGVIDDGNKNLQGLERAEFNYWPPKIRRAPPNYSNR